MTTHNDRGVERRASPRFPLQVSVRLSGRRFFVTYEGDVSEGGVFLTTAIPIARGERVEIKFTLPGGTEVMAEGIVQNQRPEEVGLGVGVKFSRIDPRFVKAIAECLAKAKR
jgi:uncharacterized protein (TIGR02266 family)